MWWLSVVGFVGLAGYVGLVINRYSELKRTPEYLIISLFLAVYIPFSIILLVPIDLASSSSDGTPLVSLPERATYAIWRVIYWLAFALTWAILPMLQSYLESGHIDNTMRLKEALHANARYQIMTLCAGLVGLTYFIFYAGFSFTSLKALVIALSHSYSLILSIWLMGNGLVNLPRTTFVNASPDTRLRKLQQRAPRVHDSFVEASSRLAEVSAEVKSLVAVKDGPYQEWIDDLLDSISPNTVATRHASRSQITEAYLSSLTRRLRTALTRKARFESEWNHLILNASEAMDIIEARKTHQLIFKRQRTRLPARYAYYHYDLIVPALSRVFGVLLAVVSVVLVWSEITEGTNASLFGLISARTSGMVQEIFSFIVLAYMCIAAYSSLARIKIFNKYALVKRHTDSSSAIFYATQACRLTMPLSYNYVTMSPEADAVSVFGRFLQRSINLTPLGEYFNAWLPRFVLIPVLFSIFNIFDRLRDCLGFGMEFGDDEDEVGNRIEGRDLINYELNGGRSAANAFLRSGRSTPAPSLNTRTAARPGSSFAVSQPSTFSDEPEAGKVLGGIGRSIGGFASKIKDTIKDRIDVERPMLPTININRDTRRYGHDQTQNRWSAAAAADNLNRDVFGM
ncbi:LMBR1-like membrane protein-domain-containing protein [Dipodascopsis tothii]|uniref:LMBR1-like membrane protein-domain-containing protein n=1 Tax=Dipodascopsis tothii TaxID=44089 RepID=UPI0034CE19B6